MSKNMVERVAMALATEYHGRETSPEYVFGEATGGYKFIDLARAAIEAMDPPTEAMLDAGAQAPDIGATHRETLLTWQAMLTAALKP